MIHWAKGPRFYPMAFAPFPQSLRTWRPNAPTQLVVGLGAALGLALAAIGPARLIYAFEAVIIGGLGSLWGTLAGGIIIGFAQTVGAKLNPEWQILAGHIAFLVVVVLRPRGLFPRAID